MRHRLSVVLCVAIILIVVPSLGAQDQGENQPKPSILWGGFDVHGSAGVGYRFIDVKGYEPMFTELYDLRKGPRVTDFSLFGKSDGTNPFADSFSLTTSSLGGDPYPTAQLSLSKAKVYDLRVNWRQSYFYWNQNDDIILPTRGTTGLTSNHDWATVRKLGSIDLTLHATNNLRFNFEYYRTSFSGATYTTFSPFFFGQPDSLGSFARANAYFTYSPTFDNNNRFTGGLDYTWQHWNFHYNIGYQTYTENLFFNNVTSPQRAIDTTTAGTAKQLLTSAQWSDFRELKTPVSEFSYNGQPTSRLELRGSYIFYRYRGPATIDRSFSGNNPAAYSVSETGRSEVTEPNHVFEQGFTYTIMPWWNIDGDYRFLRFTTSTEGVFSSLYNGTTAATGAVENQWKDTLHQFDFSMMFTPKSNLIIRPGVSLYKSNVEMFEDGTLDDARSLETKSVSPILSVFYRPTSRLSLRGDIHTYTRGSSYTALTPHTELTTRVVANLRLTQKLSLDNELYTVSQRLLATDFHARIRANTTTLAYTLNEHYTAFGGVTYDSEFASGFTSYARPTAGLRYPLRDQAVNRVWQAGLDAKPVKYFGIRFTGNYERTTGVGQESGIKPVYGPLTYPYATGTVYADFARAGRFSVDLQRTYYIQEIIAGNNFSANLLTIRWDRQF